MRRSRLVLSLCVFLPGAAAAQEQATSKRMTGDYKGAIAAYREILKSDGGEKSEVDPPVTRRRLASAIGLAACFAETGQYGEALDSLRSVGAEGKAETSWQAAMAEALAVVGRYDEAIAHARRGLDLDPQNHQARYLLGRVYETVGQRDRAIETYEFFDRLLVRRVPTDAPGLTAAAKGFYRYSVLTRHPNLNKRTVHVLQELLQPTYERLDRQYWPARLAAADLLRSKFKNDEAAEDYKAALRINGKLAAAHIGLGWVAQADWRFEAVEKQIALARQYNPRAIGAFHLQAALKLTERRYDDALRAAEQALAINPNDLEALGYAAAAKLSLYDHDGVAVFRARAEAVTPAPAAFHRIVADTLSALRQYEESEKAYKSAIAADPTDPHPRTELGLMYMQWGEERKAHAALEAAWQLDNFDARTHNTLSLLESLESFDVHETEHFIIKYDAKTDAVLPIYVADYLEEIVDEICEDYETSLRDKTIIEIFPTHRMFAVRITGKPWIHTVGACTGRVIAMEAPRLDAKLQGPYHYARVLRHEFTHTVTLAATHNRIAHWFTEGLAVFQEDTPRRFEWCQLLADAVRRDELFTLESIDWGFIRPRRPSDRALAYAQSEWMCEYMVARYGYSSLNRALAAFRSGRSQEGVFQEVLGTPTAEFDRAFAVWARDQAATWGLDLRKPESVAKLAILAEAHPDDAQVHGRLAAAELDEGNIDKALTAARRGTELDPKNALSLTILGRTLSAHREMVHKKSEREQIDTELAPAMQRLLQLDPDGWVAPKALGALALESSRHEEAIRHFKHLKRVRPLDPASYRGLAGVYLTREAYDDALPELRELARTQDSDADIPATLGMIHARRNQLGEARYWYTESLYIDPYSTDHHRKLADVCVRMNDLPTAAREYEVLCTLAPNEVEHFEGAAIAHHKLGHAAAAQRFARQAVALDPDTSVRTLIRDQ